MRRGSAVSRPVAKSMIPAWIRGGSLARRPPGRGDSPLRACLHLPSASVTAAEEASLKATHGRATAIDLATLGARLAAYLAAPTIDSP